MYRLILLTLIPIALLANDKSQSLDDLLDALKKGNYKERNAAITKIDRLSKEDKHKLRDILKKSNDPELKQIFEKKFQTTTIFEGSIGLFGAQMVMTLIREGKSMSGSYYYSRYQKVLTLSGSYDSKTELIKLTERYNNKITGYFEGYVDDNSFKGKWYKTKDRKGESDFKLKKIDGKKEKRIFNKYSKAFDVLVVGEPDPIQVETSLRVSHINAEHFSFYFKVWGGNAHTGSMQGVAKFIKPGVAKYNDGDGAELVFHFNNKGVKTVANELCYIYCGVRAGFNWELKKE